MRVSIRSVILSGLRCPILHTEHPVTERLLAENLHCGLGLNRIAGDF